MGDFWQHGPLVTIHSLPGVEERRLSDLIRTWARKRPLALLIPALAAEMDGSAFPLILRELKSVDYVARVVLALGRASAEDFARAKGLLEGLPVPSAVVWPESRNLAPLFDSAREQVDIGPPGKGRDVWIALGYLLGEGGVHALALHDADIVTYSAGIPLRLLSPLAHPDLNFSFCKGYYARVSDSGLAGRATRLLVTPLLSLLENRGSSPALRAMAAMRYPLSGEFSLTAELAGAIPIPRDWGLEVGILSAVAESVGPERICQVDICENYDHKHQDLSPGDRSRGLNRMAVEVSANILREARFSGPVEELAESYRKEALALIPAYRADALVNGLPYDEGKERAAVETFAKAIEGAAELLDQGGIVAPLPAWKEMEKRSPGLRDAIVKAVKKDNG